MHSPVIDPLVNHFLFKDHISPCCGVKNCSLVHSWEKQKHICSIDLSSTREAGPVHIMSVAYTLSQMLLSLACLEMK